MGAHYLAYIIDCVVCVSIYQLCVSPCYNRCAWVTHNTVQLFLSGWFGHGDSSTGSGLFDRVMQEFSYSLETGSQACMLYIYIYIYIFYRLSRVGRTLDAGFCSLQVMPFKRSQNEHNWHCLALYKSYMYACIR